jgi:hypothetical protein
MVAELGICLDKTCVHFVDSSRFGHALKRTVLGMVGREGGFRATIFAPKTSYLFGPTAGGLALAEDFSISAIPFLANSASSGCLAR